MATIDPTPEQLLAHITGQPLHTGIHSNFNACMYRAGCQQTEAALAALQTELATLRKDAERYRKWRAAFTSERDEDVMYKLADAWEPEAVDAVLDAARAVGVTMNKQTDERQASAGQVDRPVRPRAWLTSEPDGNDGKGSYGGMREGVELGAERPDCGTEPLYDQAAIDAAVAAERERWRSEIAKVRDEFNERFKNDNSSGYKKWEVAALRLNLLLTNAANEAGQMARTDLTRNA